MAEGSVISGCPSVAMATSWAVPACGAWSPRTRPGRPPPVGGEQEKQTADAQWVLPSSKDSTPESTVLAASFSCRLLMISCSSEPELFWGRQRRRGQCWGHGTASGSEHVGRSTFINSTHQETLKGTLCYETISAAANRKLTEPLPAASPISPQ